MKKSILFLVFAMLTGILSGCILSKTPNTNNVTMNLGEQKTFSVNVFPSKATYSWTLNGLPISNTGKSYVYTALGGNHTLIVKAKHALGTDTQTWNITTPLSEPITELLNSMVSIPAGSFMMGSDDNSYDFAQYTTPVHQVTLQTFDIGKYEVTQAQFLAVMGTNPSYFQGTGYPDSANRPVESVTWYEAHQFCAVLSTITSRLFTLPSEAQWEYACRAGTTTLYSWGDSESLIGDYAWWWLNSDGTGGPYGTHPVGTRLPNAWGLYDMHGNVWEWCLDSGHVDYNGAPTDGSAWEPEIGSYRMYRSGSWDYIHLCSFRSAHRYGGIPDDRYNDIGFRVVAIP
jgi:eukaryotic-like serine/threonine-protein kinase